MKNNKYLFNTVLTGAIGIILAVSSSSCLAQVTGRTQLRFSQQFRLGSRIIRVAEPGQLADSVNVWGDIHSPGRYLIPINTTLPELISYALGPQTRSNRNTQLNWSKRRVEVAVSDFNPETGKRKSHILRIGLIIHCPKVCGPIICKIMM